MHVCIYQYVCIGLVEECLPMARKTWVQTQVKSYQRQKMVLDTSLLNTQQYNVRIKGNVEQSRKRSRALSYTTV